MADRSPSDSSVFILLPPEPAPASRALLLGLWAAPTSLGWSSTDGWAEKRPLCPTRLLPPRSQQHCGEGPNQPFISCSCSSWLSAIPLPAIPLPHTQLDPGFSWCCEAGESRETFVIKWLNFCSQLNSVFTSLLGVGRAKECPVLQAKSAWLLTKKT